MVRKLQQQIPAERTSKSWRTAWLVSEIRKLIPKIQYLLPTHTRRAGNKPVDWLANWGFRNRGKEIDSEGLPRLHEEEKNQLQQLLDEDAGKKSMGKKNSQDPTARNGGDDTRDLQGSDRSHMRNGRGVRQAHDGHMTGHDRNDRTRGRGTWVEATLKKNLEPAPELETMDRGRTTYGNRSQARLRQEQPDRERNDEA